MAHPKPGVIAANQPTPAQILITDMQQGKPGAGEKLLSLAPKAQYATKNDFGYSIHPQASIAKNGDHHFYFPPQVDPKAIAFNKEMKAKFAKEFPGDTYDSPDTGYKPLKEEVIKPEAQYNLTPTSPDYLSQVAQIAKEQNINLTQLNQIESVKGGHGQIPAAQISIVNKHKKKASDYGL